jgi:hypothetical protein
VSITLHLIAHTICKQRCSSLSLSHMICPWMRAVHSFWHQSANCCLLAAGVGFAVDFFVDFFLDFFVDFDFNFDFGVVVAVGFVFFFVGAMAVPLVTFFVLLPSPCTFFTCANFPSRDWIHCLSSSINMLISSCIRPLRVERLVGHSASTTAAMRSAVDVRHDLTVTFVMRLSCSFCLI